MSEQPWKSVKTRIYTGDGGFDIRDLPKAEGRAAFIIKAVNNHDALVKALQALVDQVNDYERVNNLAPSPGRTECWDTVARAKELLASVGETRGSS